MTNLTNEKFNQKITDTFLQCFAAERRWVYWRYEPKEGFSDVALRPVDATDNKDYLKRPMNPKSLRHASVNRPSDWGTFDDAMAAIAKDPRAEGAGIILTGDGLVCVDADGVRDPKTGTITPEAQALLNLLQSPVEASVSGTGLHIFAQGDLPSKFHRRRWEVYATKRFIALTFDFLPDYPVDVLPDRTDELSTLIKAETSLPRGALRVDRYVSTLTDAEVVRRITQDPYRRERFHVLSNSTGGGDDKSEVDWELLALIGDHTCDIEQVVRIFENTTLGRHGRWVTTPAYRETTIRKLSEYKALDWSLFKPERSMDRGDPAKKFKFYSVLEALQLHPPEYIIDGYLPEGVIAMLYGPSGHGKSFLCLDMAFHVALGTDWQGHKVRKTSVVYLASEGGSGISKRLRAWLEYHKIDPEAVSDMQLLFETANLADPQQAEEFIRALEAMETPPGLLFFDTLSWLMVGGDENTSRDAGRVLDVLRVIREKFGTTSVLIHHTGHDGKLPRGSSAWIANCDVRVKVEPLDGSYFQLVMEKQKDDELVAPKAFERVVVPLESMTRYDAAGPTVPVTSCVIELRDLAAAQFAGHNAKEQAILDALETFGAVGATQTDLKKTAVGCETGGPLFESAKKHLLVSGQIVADPIPEGKKFKRGRRFWITALAPDDVTQGAAVAGKVANREP